LVGMGCYSSMVEQVTVNDLMGVQFSLAARPPLSPEAELKESSPNGVVTISRITARA
jgi:hypothetical protein